MKRFVEGIDRSQSTLLSDRLEDWIDNDNPVHVFDVFVDELDLDGLPSLGIVEALYLRLSQPGSIEPAFGAGSGRRSH